MTGLFTHVCGVHLDVCSPGEWQQEGQLGGLVAGLGQEQGQEGVQVQHGHWCGQETLQWIYSQHRTWDLSPLSPLTDI